MSCPAAFLEKEKQNLRDDPRGETIRSITNLPPAPGPAPRNTKTDIPAVHVISSAYSILKINISHSAMRNPKKKKNYTNAGMLRLAITV